MLRVDAKNKKKISELLYNYFQNTRFYYCCTTLLKEHYGDDHNQTHNACKKTPRVNK